MVSRTSEAPSSEPAAFYDAMWNQYASFDAISPAAFHRRRMMVELVRRFAPSAQAVLDVGCGTGALMRELARELPAARIIGADVSLVSIESSQRQRPDFETFQMDLSDADFEEHHALRRAQYDLLTCSEVLEHIADDTQAVRRLRSLLRPGGHLIASVPGGKMSRFDERIGHHRHYDREQFRRLLSESRFELRTVIAWGFPFHNLYRSAVRLASRATWSEPAEPSKRTPGLQPWLGAAYHAFSGLLKPLYYLNQSFWGEQLFAVGQRPD
ncbi:MAG TPA: class I SAM-dependent methyltransferase [Polyangiaceae bacterium]